MSLNKTFEDLFHENAGFGFAKQMVLADVLEERDWSVDIEKGQVHFGDDLAYPIQLLGTESEADGTWLWAWANDESTLPPDLLKSCLSLRELGKAEKIPQLTEASFSIDSAGGHMLSMIASGLNLESCYYRGPYDGGALYFLINDVEEVILPIEPQTALTAITEVIANFDVNHRKMADHFLSGLGFDVTREERRLVADTFDCQITIEFDELSRITDINGRMEAEPPPQKKKRNWKFWQKNA